MQLFLDRLAPGRSEVPLAGDLAVGDGDDAYTAQVHGSLTLDTMEQRYLLSGSFQARRAAVCDLCAEPFTQTFDAEVYLLILRRADHDERRLAADDSWVVTASTGVIDVDAPLAEAVALAEPLQTLCREECGGLCPTCGQNRNEGSCRCEPITSDPRWEKLAQLRKPAP